MGRLSIKAETFLLIVGERILLHVGSETGLTPTLNSCLASTKEISAIEYYFKDRTLASLSDLSWA